MLCEKILISYELLWRKSRERQISCPLKYNTSLNLEIGQFESGQST